MSLYSVKALLILDSKGKRIVAKYYPQIEDEFGAEKEKEAFEKSLWEKTHKSSSDIALFNKYIVVYKSAADLIFYVIGDQHENELILWSILNSYYDAISILLRGLIDKRMVLENLDYVLIALDELIDGGILFETDPDEIAQRTALKSSEEVPIAEQDIKQFSKTATDAVLRFLRN
mmetsp:Transcript_4878/g.5288  ORF Transcript_4878/g.5288 Transcript_4878/m.5288 type:complete len:175 (+) Transcript_4878:38-562(+)